MSGHGLYRALLRCYPAPFRDEYGEQMQFAFNDQLNDAQRRGLVARVRLWAGALMEAIAVAPKEHWHVLRQDLRYAVRLMAANVGFTTLAIVSLALCIGAVTAIFGLWNKVLYASLPGVRDPGALVMLTSPDDTGNWVGRWTSRTDGPRSWLTYQEFQQIRDGASDLSGVMASQSNTDTWSASLNGVDRDDVRGRLVSAEYFDVLGVRPAMGRLFSAREDLAAPEVVISNSFWRRLGAADVLGKTLVLDRVALTVIGVTPAGFVGETADQMPDVWLPLKIQPRLFPDSDWLHDVPPEKHMWLNVFGRIKAGATLEHVQAQANALLQAELRSFYGADAAGPQRDDFLDQYIRVSPGAKGASSSRQDFKVSLTLLFVAVGVLLLIACANLANLLLARATARGPEIAIRLSLGARRGRIVRQLVTESLLLAGIAGVAATGIAYVFHGVLVQMLARSNSRFQVGFAFDWPLLAFLIGASVTAALVFGVIPGRRTASVDPESVLKQQGRGAAGSIRQRGVSRWLVALQLAMSLPLLVGAGLLVRTVRSLEHVDLGFPSRGLLVARLDLRSAAQDEARRDALRRDLAFELRSVPGVAAVSFSQLGLFTGGSSVDTVEIDGVQSTDPAGMQMATDRIGPGYFTSLGVPMLAGREIDATDRAGGVRVCVINAAFARRYFDRRNPVGAHITKVHDAGGRSACEIVGVAGNVRSGPLREDVAPRYYQPIEQEDERTTSPIYLIRASSTDANPAAAIREILRRAHPDVKPLYVRTLSDQMAPLTAEAQTTAILASAFGAAAVALAAIGLYGVLSYGVARRTREIAMRLALGAQRSRVMSMIFGDTLRVVVAGLAAGVLLTLALLRLIERQLYGVAPHDPLTVALAAAMLILVAIVAAYAPARRAARLEPTIALKQE